jgi:ABC-type bacteriocin/lantibiotic exporter with double-glycine peptidase domain
MKAVTEPLFCDTKRASQRAYQASLEPPPSIASAGRGSVRFEALRWALRFVELEDDIDALPRGLETPVLGGGKLFRKSLILRILVARAIVTQLSLLIFDGTLHNMEPSLRQILLRWLCSKDESWSIIFVSNDPTIGEFVDRHVLLG